MTDETPQTTKRVEQTEHGYQVTIESKRGTGTRDQDKVRMQARTEGYPDSNMLLKMERDVTDLMEERRQHQPDAEETDE